MSNQSIPHFPRGFLLSENPTKPPLGYIEGPILPNFYVHPWTNVEVAGDEHSFVIIIGHSLTIGSDLDGSAANHLLKAFQTGEGHFFRELDYFSGRYAILFGSTGNIKIVNDATAMRAVFYAARGGVVASHALLVERTLGGPIYRDELPFKYGYPGNKTPYPRTLLLTANTYYWLTAHVVGRYWPIVPPPSRTVDDAAHFSLESATTAMRNFAKDRTIKIALTAGVDSRTILAVGLHAGVDFETYTYGDGPDTVRDRNFAKDLAALAGVKHSVVPRPLQSNDLDQRLAEAHYQAHHAKHVGGLIDFFADPHAAAVTGNLLEIGRDNYALARKAGVAAPQSAEAMAELHRRTMGSRMKPVLEEYGLEQFFGMAKPAFQGFIDDTGISSTEGILDPFDQFYWEHWMSTWHGTAMNERDFYAEAFIPFNARKIFEAMIGVSREERDSSAVFFRIINIVNPKLLELPINPKKWPTVENLATPGS